MTRNRGVALATILTGLTAILLMGAIRTGQASPPAVSATVAAVPAAVLNQPAGPVFPLPQGATVSEQRSIAGDSGWVTVAATPSADSANAFYTSLVDDAWLALPGGVDGSHRYRSADGTWDPVTVRVYGDVVPAQIRVTLARAVKPPDQLTDGSSLITWPLPSMAADPSQAAGFPAAFRLVGLEVIGEVVTDRDALGSYRASGTDIEAVEARYDPVVRALDPAPTLRTSPDAVLIRFRASGRDGFVLLTRRPDGMIEVKVSVPR